MKLPGAEHEIEVGQLFEQLVAEPLGHAAERTDHQIGTARLEFLHVADLAFGLAFGLFADTAGVEEENIRLLLVFDDRVAGFDQHSGERFGIALIHLASVGFEEYFHGVSSVRLSRWMSSSSTFGPRIS